VFREAFVQAPKAAAPIVEEALDEETEKYVAQALTDADLFSSYGLTQKATHLLESVLQRAPRHVSTLERLLDSHLGSGDDKRTAELAAQLEQIHVERGDTVNAERFAELRQRYQKLAGVPAEQLAPAPPAAPPAPVQPPVAQEKASAIPLEVAPTSPAAAGPAEFEIVLTPSEPEANVEAPVAATQSINTPEPVEAAAEVDLSDEWEAMVQEVVEPAAAKGSQTQQAEEPVAEEEIVEAAPGPEPTAAQHAADAPMEPVEEILAADGVAAGNGDVALELTPEPSSAQAEGGATTTEDFLSELAAEIEGMETPEAKPTEASAPKKSREAKSVADAAKPAPVAAAPPAVPAPMPEPTAESLNQLAEIFQEFRSDLDEIDTEDEDLETHYNLGIAYREMGLLDEAIGEFQKVAKAVQKGKPFAYAMNCATLLALSFMDKGEPKIAALWYQRALETPELDQETILALRYDLGVALENAGESSSALDRFREVYAMNIDYRDVADRISILQKQ